MCVIAFLSEKQLLFSRRWRRILREHTWLTHMLMLPDGWSPLNSVAHDTFVLVCLFIHRTIWRTGWSHWSTQCHHKVINLGGSVPPKFSFMPVTGLKVTICLCLHNNVESASKTKAAAASHAGRFYTLCLMETSTSCLLGSCYRMNHQEFKRFSNEVLLF